MKKILLLFLFLTASGLTADLYSKNHTLYEIKTKHFTFIYPKDCEASALYLAQNSEKILEEICALLNTHFNEHIPVIFTADNQTLNGAFSPMPSNRIYLYVAPISPNNGFVAFNDSLNKLFLHELTHAVSMNIRDLFSAFLSAIFGDIISPPIFAADLYYIEGVTVSFESRDGFGRAVQTNYNAIIQQDIIEGKFKNPEDTGSTGSFYPSGTWYIYGGSFSKYLQDKYGMEKYAQLWKQFGNGIGAEDFLFFKGAIEMAYGVPLKTLWEDFRQYMAIKIPIVTDNIPLTQDPALTGPLTSSGNSLFYVINDDLIESNLSTAKQKKLATTSFSVDSLHISQDGKKLLVGDTIYDSEGLALLRIRIVDLVTGKISQPNLPSGMKEASWFHDGILGVRNKGYTADVIFCINGETEILFSGREFLVPGAPVQFSDNEIVFLVNEKGSIKLLKMDAQTRELSELKTSVPLKNIRHLSCSDSVLTFAYDNDLTLFKLGLIRDGKLQRQVVPISGGIGYPVSLSDDFYYVGAFSEGPRLMQYPTDNPALALESSPISWIAYSPPLDVDRPLTNKSDYKINPYNALGWTLIPQLWFPLVGFKSYVVDYPEIISAGFLTMSSDPSFGHAIAAQFMYYFDQNFVSTQIEYVNSTTPITIDLMGFMLPYDDAFSYTDFGGQIMLSQSIPLTESMNLGWSAQTAINFYGENQIGVYPYLWPVIDIFVPLHARITLSSRDAGLADPYHSDRWETGLSIDGWSTPMSEWMPKTTVGVFASSNFDFLKFSASAFARISLDQNLFISPVGVLSGINIINPSVSGFSGFSWYANRQDLADFWYVGFSSQIGHDIEINDSSLAGLQILSLYFRTGYKGAFCDGTLLNALYAQVGITSGLSAGIIGINGINPGMTFYYLPNQDENNQTGWEFYFSY